MKIINCQTLGELCEFMLDGEPVFIIRAKDKVALGAIDDYMMRAFDAGATNLGRTRTALQRMKDWQEANPSKVKVAD